MKVLIRPGTKLTSDVVARVLDHQHQSRLARKAYEESGKTIIQVAEEAEVGRETVNRFLGYAGDRSTRDPRTSTTRKILHVLGFEMVIVRRAEHGKAVGRASRAG